MRPKFTLDFFLPSGLPSPTMPPANLQTLFPGLLLLAIAAPCRADESANLAIQIVETDEGFLFKEADAKVLFYQRRPKSLDGTYSRANYIHPLYDLDGEIWTQDFPPDHPHQRGVYWAWHQMRIGDKTVGDPWVAKDFVWDIKDAQILPGDSQSAALKVGVLWKSPNWLDAAGQQKPFVKESTVIRVHRAAAGARKIDLEISLLALEDDVRIGGAEDEKGYGGFSVRMRMPKGVEITGRGGTVSPRNEAVEAGPWVDFSGTSSVTDRVGGLAILCHSSLPGFPPSWVLRRGGSMQNPVYPGREPVTLSREKPLVLRYRLVLHHGNARDANMDKLQSEYEQESGR